MRRLLMAAGLIVIGSVAHGAGWTPPLTVESGFTENSNDLIIITSGGAVYTTGCSQNNWVFRANSDAQRGRAWATILTALASGLRVKFWYTDNCGTYAYHDAIAVMIVRE
jgi:hypothetical protein